MCDEKLKAGFIVGAGLSFYFGILAYSAYEIYSGTESLALTDRITSCACSVIQNCSNAIRADISALLGPGVSISNTTAFCEGATSTLNLVKSAANSTIIKYSFYTGGMVLVPIGVCAKKIYDMRKANRQAQGFERV